MSKPLCYELTHKGEHRGWVIFCPGCKCAHHFDQRWTFNGDVTAPTFKPSMLVNGNRDPKFVNPTRPRCHSFVTDGKIKFLGDCTHDMAGQTVALEPIEQPEADDE